MEYGTEQNIDRRACHRVVPMKVLALGCGRTGTNSLCHALKLLGLRDTYHMSNCSGKHPRDCDMWIDAFRAKYDGVGTFGRPEWDMLLGHCMAVTDFPAACFAPELVAAYPEAKVILTSRDVDAWYNSVASTINWRTQDRVLYILSFLDWGYWHYAPMAYIQWDRFFRGSFEANAKTVFAAHNDQVRSLVPPERLLEYDVRQGWEPLCKFLNVPVPDTPFPSGNNQEDFHASCRAKDKIKAMRAAGYAGAMVAGLAACGIAWLRLRR